MIHTLSIDIREIEDRIINPLTAIHLMAVGTEIEKEIGEQVSRIVRVLEEKELIGKRCLRR